MVDWGGGLGGSSCTKSVGFKFSVSAIFACCCSGKEGLRLVWGWKKKAGYRVDLLFTGHISRYRIPFLVLAKRRVGEYSFTVGGIGGGNARN